MAALAFVMLQRRVRSRDSHPGLQKVISRRQLQWYVWTGKDGPSDEVEVYNEVLTNGQACMQSFPDGV